MAIKSKKNNSVYYLFMGACTITALVLFFRTEGKKEPKKIIYYKDTPAESKTLFDSIEKNKYYYLVEKVLTQEKEYREELRKNIEDISEKIGTFCTTNQYVCKNFNYTKLKNKMRKDQSIMLRIRSYFTNIINSANPKIAMELKKDAPWYTNKMPEAIDFAIGLVDNKANLHAILNGKIPDVISVDWTKPTLFGRVSKDDKGTNNMLGFIVAMSYIADTFRDNDGAALVQFDGINYKAISYQLPIPNYIDIGSEIDKEIMSYTFYKKRAINLFYNGQEFGARNIQDKNFYPKDSSLWLGELLKIPTRVTTLDLMSLHNEINSSGYVAWDMESIKYRNNLISDLKVLDINNIEDIHPGTIIAERYFEEKDDILYKSGIGGRLGMIIGTDAKSAIFVMSYTGDIDMDRNGFGIEVYKFKPDTNSIQMFFKVRNV